MRIYRPGDESIVVDIWNATLTRDPLSVDRFVRRTLGDPNFNKEGLLIVEADGQPAGFALAVAPGETKHLFSQPVGQGRITGLGVLPQFRKRGIGSALLEAATGFLKSRGCRRVSFAAHEYYVAGLDREAYADGLRFLIARGFKETYEAVAMARELYDLEVPAAARETATALRKDGITAEFFTPGDRGAVEDFFRAEFPDWVEFFQAKLDAGDPHEDIAIIRTPKGVAGYCQRLEADHVGPFGVSESLRGRGAGTVMLYLLLEGMRRRGYRFVWFGETGRAQPYYARAGFKVTRKYAVMGKDL
jgi:ribosomal protein S18 acetylase RimI-like enzyme